MEYIQASWKDGSAFNNGLTAEEYFYNQIYEAVKENVREKTLPFFKEDASSLPVELSTGKIINDENLIALDQVASKNRYSSTVWIYGDTLERLQKEGIRVNFKKGTEPVLCLTKYANANHLNEELYIAEGGNKSKAQFLYNYDSLDERSKKQVEKHFENVKNISASYTAENFSNYKENIINSRTKAVPELKRIREALVTISNNASSLIKKGISALREKDFDLSQIMNAHARHMCQVVTGANVKNFTNPKVENSCYAFLSSLIENTEAYHGQKWLVGQAITKALDAGTKYARSYTSKNFNLEYRKERDEKSIKVNRAKNRDIYSLEY